jgi:hypothetical protein
MTLSEVAVSDIAARLALLPIWLPASMGEDPCTANKEQYLRSLLKRDAGIFLERYGTQLDASERECFQDLRSHFEIDFYMKQLENAAAQRSTVVTVRNRRLAHMSRLEKEGDYFSEVVVS